MQTSILLPTRSATRTAVSTLSKLSNSIGSTALFAGPPAIEYSIKHSDRKSRGSTPQVLLKVSGTFHLYQHSTVRFL